MASEKHDTFLSMRNLAKALPEEILLSMITDNMAEYVEDKTEDKRRELHGKMMMLTLKWGDEIKGNNFEDIKKDTARLEEITQIHKGMGTVNGIINPEDGS